jgi:hypothetical protein
MEASARRLTGAFVRNRNVEQSSPPAELESNLDYAQGKKHNVVVQKTGAMTPVKSLSSRWQKIRIKCLQRILEQFGILITDQGSVAGATLWGFRTTSGKRSGRRPLRTAGGKRGCV